MTRADSFARAKKLPRVKFYVGTGEKAKKTKSKAKTSKAIKENIAAFESHIAHEQTRLIDSLLNTLGSDFSERLSLAEARAFKAEEELSFIKSKLCSFLSKDQLDAASICGCSPEIYALEFIELWKECMWPKFGVKIRPFSDLKMGA